MTVITHFYNAILHYAHGSVEAIRYLLHWSHYPHVIPMTTLFLAAIWGPILLAFGIGMFVSRAHYETVYRHMEREPLATVGFGFMAMAFGVVHVMVHSFWMTPLEIVVSLLGWGLLLKGIAFIVIPRFADKRGDWFAHEHLLPASGTLAGILGAYLTWVAFLSF